MKKIFSLAVVALCVSMTANAQIGESKSKKIETTVVSAAPNANYNRILIGYAQTHLSANDWFLNSYNKRDEAKSASLHGFTTGWMYGINVTKGKCLPLYVEPGAAINFGIGEAMTDKDKILSFEVPVNVTYRYKFPNTNIRISPYMGIHFKVNILAMGEIRDESYNLFSSDDFKYSDGMNRFQMGMQLGANFEFSRFFVGLGWNYDFIPIFSETIRKEDYNVTTSGVRVKLGLTF